MKQVDFPRTEKHPGWVVPALIVLSLACGLAVALLLLGDTSGPFIGPYW